MEIKEYSGEECVRREEFNVAILVLPSEFPLFSSGRWPVEEKGIIMRKTKTGAQMFCQESAVCAPSGTYSELRVLGPVRFSVVISFSIATLMW